MKKYAVSLEPQAVARMREEARLTAAREHRDVSWVSLLRGLMNEFLARAGAETNVAENAGGRR